MKAVILAGGLGTRISEESHLRPKPMIEIGGQPILWHIMKIYAHHGINEFIVCLGYRGYMIKEYFANYFLHHSDVTIDVRHNNIEFHQTMAEPWRITLVDTGETTQTGGRLKRVAKYLDPNQPFCFTYGDGLSDVNITDLVAFHRQHGKQASLTAVTPPSRFGALQTDGEDVQAFIEKPPGDQGLINGGFFVLDPATISLIDNDFTSWEGEPLSTLANGGELKAWHHNGFWQPMDTMRDKLSLESLWASGNAPWKVWL